MPRGLSLVAVLASLPALALAQGAAPNASVCGGSQLRHSARLRQVGQAMFGATAAADLAAVLTIPRSPAGAEEAGSHFRVVTMTAPVALAGLFIATRATPGDGFWRDVMTRLKVGVTRSTDVERCLRQPAAKTSNGADERWTYLINRPTLLDASRFRSLHLTFRDSVLTEVLTKEVSRDVMTGAGVDSGSHPLDRHHGFCAPPIPVIADPFPTPTDTTAAAAAMARAQADAEAASKNAAAFAAYAVCMASDSAR